VNRHSPHLITALQIARSSSRLAWLAGTIALIAVVALPHLLPAVGREMYVVSGASMEPTIPIGSVVFVHQIDPNGVQPGQIVTYQLPNSTAVTHRVIARSEIYGATTFEMKGDANASADPSPVPASALVGDVEFSVPAVGALIVSLSSTAGELMLIFCLGGLLLAGWFFDELLATLRRSSPSRTVVRVSN
jgi:signal peptidase